MRALRHDAQSLLSGSPRVISDLPNLTPPTGHALVKVSKVGLDEADALAAQYASREQSGRTQGALGHEFVGVVKEINLPEPSDPRDTPSPASLGPRSLLVGRRVIASPSIACARCDMCRAGMSGHCRNRRVLGLSGADGCLAGEVVVPLMNLIPVSDRVDDDRAVFAGVVARALHTMHLVRATGKAYVTVLGDNVLALATAQVLSRLNKSVRLLGTHGPHMALCDRWGVKSRPVSEAGRRQDQDVVIDCTGGGGAGGAPGWENRRGLRLAMQFVRPRGTIILKDPGALAPPSMPTSANGGRGTSDAGTESLAEPVDFSPLVASEVTLIGSRDGPLPDALDLLEREEVDVRPLIARKIKLDDAPAALKAILSKPMLKVIVEM